jgi:hypothetical protein
MRPITNISELEITPLDKWNYYILEASLDGKNWVPLNLPDDIGWPPTNHGRYKFYRQNGRLLASSYPNKFPDDPRLDYSTTRLKFKDAPIGARFRLGDSIYVKIHANDSGLVVQWNGNVSGHQSHCSWLDIENNIDFDTEIDCI